MPARRLFIVTVVFMTDRNLMYSHSPRRNTLFHNTYSMPRPPVQPATKLLVLSCDCVVDCDGTRSVGPGFMVVTPKASVVEMSSRLVVVLVTVRWTSMRPIARPPNIYGRKLPVAQPARPLSVIAS